MIGKADELHDAAWRCHLERVRGLLADGVDPNVPESDETGHGWSPLMLAARDPEVMAVLLVAGADPTYATPGGDLVVMAVARIGSPEGLGLLRTAGADLRKTDDTGNNALMEAAGAGNRDTVEFLLGEGLGVNDTTHNGGTALMAAAAAGQIEVARQLLAAGADPRRRLRSGPHAGKTATDLAADHGHATVAALLTEWA